MLFHAKFVIRIYCLLNGLTYAYGKFQHFAHFVYVIFKATTFLKCFPFIVLYILFSGGQ